MEFYEELLIGILSKQNIHIEFPNMDIDIHKLFEMQCYQALRIIKDILEDDSLSDPECFMKIEEIVSLYEKIGNGLDGRHDFG